MGTGVVTGPAMGLGSRTEKYSGGFFFFLSSTSMATWISGLAWAGDFKILLIILEAAHKCGRRPCREAFWCRSTSWAAGAAQWGRHGVHTSIFEELSCSITSGCAMIVPVSRPCPLLLCGALVFGMIYSEYTIASVYVYQPRFRIIYSEQSRR